MNPSHADLLARLALSRSHLPDLVEEEATASSLKRFVETVGVLGAAWVLCVGIQFAEFFGGQ